MGVHILNITKSGNGSGTVTSDAGSPPINCGDTCSTTEVSLATITLTASPSSGSVFVRWTGDVTSTNNPVSYVQELNPTNINAEFRKAKKHRIKGSIGVQNDIYFDVNVFPSGIPEVLPYNGINYVYNGMVKTPTGQNLVKFSKPSITRAGSQMVEPPIKATERVSGGGSGNHRVSGGGSGNH